MIYHFTPIRKSKTKNVILPNAGEEAEKRVVSHCRWERKMARPLGNTDRQLP